METCSTYAGTCAIDTLDSRQHRNGPGIHLVMALYSFGPAYNYGLCHYGRIPQDAAVAKKAEGHAAPAAAAKKVSVSARARTSYGWTEGPTSR